MATLTVVYRSLGEHWREAEEALSLVSGHAVFSSGGDWSELEKYSPRLREDVDRDIEQYGEVPARRCRRT